MTKIYLKQFLYLIVYEVLDGECDWTFVVDVDMYQSKAEQIALDNYCEFQDITDDKPKIDDCIGSVWYEQAYAPEHEITLTKAK